MMFVRRFLSRSIMEKRPLTIVVALDDCNGIGRNNQIPWTIKNDLKFFRYVTSQVKDSSKQNALIIGRKTYQTFPKPLPNRLNIVVSSNSKLENIDYPNVIRVDTFEQALESAKSNETIENIFIIGGVSIYEEAMKTNTVQRMYITRVKGDFQCTAVWSSFDVSGFQRISKIPDEYQTFFDHSQENNIPVYHLEIYQRNI